MENSFQTSFIPKKPITPMSPVSSGGGGSSTSLFTVLTTLLLVLVGLAAGGLYFYKAYLVKQKAGLSDSLGLVRDSFEQNTISELELFDKRVSAAKQVLNGHLVFSPMFDLLGSLTLPSIQYTKYAQEQTDKGFFVKMSGTARDYRSIALQADAFNSNKGRSFRNVVFSNLTKDKGNNVGFDVEFIVDPALLSYEKNSVLDSSRAKVLPKASATPVQSQEMTPTPDQMNTPATETTPTTADNSAVSATPDPVVTATPAPSPAKPKPTPATNTKQPTKK